MYSLKDLSLKDIHAQKVPTHRFVLNLPRRKVMFNKLLPKWQKKLGVTDFVLERTCPKNTLNLKNRALLADKATVSVTPKILQLDL